MGENTDIYLQPPQISEMSPFFLTQVEIKDIGSPRDQIKLLIFHDWNIDFMTDDGIPILKTPFFFTPDFMKPNNEFPKALNPGEFITCKVKLNRYEKHMIEKLKSNDKPHELDIPPATSPETLEKIQTVKNYYHKRFESNPFETDTDSRFNCLAVVFKDARGVPFEKIVAVQCTASKTGYFLHYQADDLSIRYEIINRKINHKHDPGIHVVYCMKDKQTNKIDVGEMNVGGLVADTLDKAKTFLEKHLMIDANRYEVTKIDEIFSADSIDDLTLYKIRDSHRYFFIRLKRLYDSEIKSSVIGFPKWLLEMEKIKLRELIQIHQGYELIEIKEITEEIMEENTHDIDPDL